MYILSYAAERNVMTEDPFENNLAIFFDLDVVHFWKYISNHNLTGRERPVNKDSHYSLICFKKRQTNSLPNKRKMVM